MHNKKSNCIIAGTLAFQSSVFEIYFFGLHFFLCFCFVWEFCLLVGHSIIVDLLISYCGILQM